MAADAPDEVPTFMGVPMKIVSLVTLTFQNSALILIMHYSRVMPTEPGHRFLTSTAVLMNEVIKLILCFGVAYRDRRKADGAMSPVVRNIYADVFARDHWKLAIPACLYTLQNSLQYLAVSNLDAATFQVTYQLKILTTALFSVTMLHRQLRTMQWVSLVLLTAGVAIVQLPTGSSSSSSEGVEMNRSLGLVAVIIACMLSGLAGVYFEKVLKGSTTTLWIRNIQLSFYSLFPAVFLGCMLVDGKEIMQRGFFDGYNFVVWTAIAFQAFGGILVALCVNYADNIAKNFATSISILISCIASVYFFDFVITVAFIAGAILVLFATYLYSKPAAPPKEPEYTPLEKTTVDGGDEELRRDSLSASASSSSDRERERV